MAPSETSESGSTVLSLKKEKSRLRKARVNFTILAN